MTTLTFLRLDGAVLAAYVAPPDATLRADVPLSAVTVLLTGDAPPPDLTPALTEAQEKIDAVRAIVCEPRWGD